MGGLPRTLAAALDLAAARTPTSPALLVPQQGLAFSYAALAARTRTLAHSLAAWGVRDRDVLVSDLPNTAENLALQLAAARLGAAVATVKSPDGVADLAGALAGRLRGCVVASGADSPLLAGAAKAGVPAAAVDAGDDPTGLHAAIFGPEPVASAEASAEEEAREAAHSGAPAELGFWGSATALTHDEALAQGRAAQEELGLGPEDRVCVAITLCHAFGIGSGVGSALLAGSAIVLPAVGGIRGCGVPAERAARTLEVLASEQCTVLFADTHTLKALADPALESAFARADLSRLRTGVVKVGSGADFLGGTVAFAGRELRTMGKRGA